MKLPMGERILNLCCLQSLSVARYYLERSNSAKLTLKRAKELFPMEVTYFSAFDADGVWCVCVYIL